MISTRLYLDSRAVPVGSPAPLKISITKRGDTAFILTGVKIPSEYWDKKGQKVIKHPQAKSLNNYLVRLKVQVDDTLREMVLSGEAALLSTTAIKNRVNDLINGSTCTTSFGEHYEKVKSKRGSTTQRNYDTALKMASRYDAGIMSRPLVEFNNRWAEGLDEWMTKEYSANSRNTIITAFSVVFNDAKKAGLIRSNPMEGIKKPYVVTRKRNLYQEQFRMLWNAEPRSHNEEVCLDLFKFSFLTIAMNSVDIARLTKDSIFNGRIEYNRAKTGKHYSVKIVDELKPLLAKYSTETALFSPFGHYHDYTIMGVVACKHLKNISKRLGLPPISLYWARHSWASFAAELDIPIDVISSALGHSHGARVTMIYINADQKKVDDANRRVIDFALYDQIK